MPETDICQVKPELCHFYQGTCRDSQWGKDHCMISHTVYLAESSHLKVGITRSRRQKTRWMEQGALQAVPILYTKNRLDAGLAEVELKKAFSDKTNWRKMLTTQLPSQDLIKVKKSLHSFLPKHLLDQVVDEPVCVFRYPVSKMPDKIKSVNLEKNPDFSGRLCGIKGQYLVFEDSVLNMRKYKGYQLSFDIESL